MVRKCLGWGGGLRGGVAPSRHEQGAAGGRVRSFGGAGGGPSEPHAEECGGGAATG